MPVRAVSVCESSDWWSEDRVIDSAQFSRAKKKSFFRIRNWNFEFSFCTPTGWSFAFTIVCNNKLLMTSNRLYSLMFIIIIIWNRKYFIYALWALLLWFLLGIPAWVYPSEANARERPQSQIAYLHSLYRYTYTGPQVSDTCVRIVKKRFLFSRGTRSTHKIECSILVAFRGSTTLFLASTIVLSLGTVQIWPEVFEDVGKFHTPQINHRTSCCHILSCPQSQTRVEGSLCE